MRALLRPRLAPALLIAAACAAPAAPSPVAPVAPSKKSPSASAAETAPPPPPAPPPVLSARARLLGHDGAPMKLAHAHMDARSWTADAEGVVEITAKAPGFHEVLCTGVDHAARAVGVLFDGAAQSFEVRLGTHAREPFAGARFYLFERGESAGASGTTALRLPKQRLLKKQPGGAYAVDIEAKGDEIVYALGDLAPGHLVNGPRADRYLYGDDGDYRSVLRAAGSTITVRVEPAELPPPGLPPSARFDAPESRSARVARLHLDAARRAEEAAAARPIDPAWRTEIMEALASERDADVAAALRIAYLVPPPAPGASAVGVARALLASLPPDASMWAFRPAAALTAVDLAGRTPALEEYLDSLALGLPDRDAAAGFVAARVRAASLAGREDELARVWTVLRDRFPDTAAARATKLLDPARRVRPGRALPDFDLPALPDRQAPPGTRFTRAGLRGKIALLDFWGTWCRPCADEMKYLDRAFAKHKGEGFVIISLATHEQSDRVRRFRGAQHAMPWGHVVLDPKVEDEILARFEVRTFPSPILVDAEGKILAVGDDVRGAALEPAVAAAIAARR